MTRDELLIELRQHVVEVFFTKVNGDERRMRCTLRPDMLPQSYKNDEAEEKDFHQKNKESLAVWDVQKGGWRSFRIESVQIAQIVDTL